jgi:CBS domain-containing protein
MEARHESQGGDDVSRCIDRAGRLDMAGRPDHAATAHISGLPVIDEDGGLVGIVTEGDFLRRAETGTQRRRPRWLEYLIGPGRLADEYTRSHGRKVSEIMTADSLICCS